MKSRAWGMLKVDPAKLDQYAKAYPAGPTDISSDLTATLNDIENPGVRSLPPNTAPANSEPLTLGDPTSTVDQAQKGKTQDTDRPGGDTQGALGGIAVVDAAKNRANAKNTGQISDAPLIQVGNASFLGWRCQ